jgi:hypothetical protein
VRVPDEVWAAAELGAQRRGTTRSAAILAALRELAAESPDAVTTDA